MSRREVFDSAVINQVKMDAGSAFSHVTNVLEGSGPEISSNTLRQKQSTVVLLNSTDS
jgi:hypothetical protein